MPYPREYWQALLDRKNENLKKNIRKDPEGYIKFNLSGPSITLNVNFNTRNNRLNTFNQAVNLQFDNYEGNKNGPLIILEENLNLDENEFFFPTFKNGKFKYHIARNLDFNLKHTSWEDLEEEYQNQLVNWHLQKIDVLYKQYQRKYQ